MSSTSSGYRSFALFAVFVFAVVRPSCGSAADVDDVPEFKVPDESVSDTDKQAQPLVLKDAEVQSQRQFKTAEIADAVMGTEMLAHSPGIEYLIPKDLQESLLGASGSCADERCEASPELEIGGSKSNEQTEPVISGAINPDTIEMKNQNFTETTKTYKVNCDKRNITGIEHFTVQVLSVSQDLMELLNANSTECSLVLFYTTWCQFSANLAPHFNALPRVFPTMHFLALDASQHSSLSTRFGTVAVPNILLFQGAKPMARFNHTDRTLETLTSFIANQTGFEASPDQTVQDEDYVGPLPAVPVKSIDWLFVFSVLFISGFTLYAILCTESIRWLIPGQEHEHQD